ncbi:MAG: LacI family DNA-binding transcriptional regulator [Burkholderiales bacterium]|nr:LacI family DNA-binding transcriptional regulator [Opitutaceae bacterium]
MSDLARIAGCSVNTISLALRDSPRISPATRERIHDLAREHGYRINPMVSALISSRRKTVPTQTIGILTKFARPFDEPAYQPQFYVELMRGIRAKAAALGFSLAEFPCAQAGAPDAKRLTQILLARGIRGVLLFPSGEVETPYPSLEWKHFAVLAAGFHARNWPVHRTALDQGRAMEICLHQLTARGIRRIGFGMTRALDARWGYAASGRFLSWQACVPPRDRIPLVPGDAEIPQEIEFKAWVLEHRPEAVIIYYDFYVKQLEEIEGEHGIKVIPVTINSSDLPEVAGVTPRVAQLGATSIGVLARELYLNHYGIPAEPEITLVGSDWHDGTRLGPIPPGQHGSGVDDTLSPMQDITFP